MNGDAEYDHQLLARYVKCGDQAAFAALARRHAGLVYAAARRQMQDAHLAHDVTQVVFLVLAKKAATIPPRTVLAAWLLKATRYTANNMSKSEFRRRRREQVVALGKRDEAGCSASAAAESEGGDWEQVAPLLDDALDSLGESGRSAVVLRWFEGKSFRDVGERLGVSEEAAKQKVFRALGRMRRYMAQRGVAVPLAALATLVAANAATAAPAATVEAAAAAGVPGAAAAVASSQAVVQTVSTLMGWTKAKILVGCFAAILTLSGAAVAVKIVLAESRGFIPGGTQLTAASASPKQRTTIPKPEGVVLAPNDRPLQGASILLSNATSYAYTGQPALTDAQGRFSLPVINEPYFLLVWHNDAGFAELTDEQLAGGGGRINLLPWAKLEGRATIAGAPAANATIVLGHWSQAREASQMTTLVFETKADAEGRFAFPRVPVGDGWVARQVDVGSGPAALLNRTYLTAQPAQRLKVVIGGAGSRAVVGKFVDTTARPDDKTERTWRVALVRTLDLPSGGGKIGQVAYQGSMFDTDLLVSADGSFRADDVPAGHYRLVGKEHVKSDGKLPASNLIEQYVEVTSVGGILPPPLDLGTIRVTQPPLPGGSTASVSPKRGGEQ
jgi:RNA polymerase sigma factor (sigma-70 family)